MDARWVTDGEPCPACGRQVYTAVEGRCPFCGERLHDADVTSDDHTPYAEAGAAGFRAYRLMCRWVYGANKQRLAHLGLVRPSHASRKFARQSLLIASVATAIFVFANAGWHVVQPISAERTQPQGKGWWQAIDRGDSTLGAHAGAALWWNLPWATVAAVAALVLTLVVGFVLVWWVGRGAQRALRGSLQGTPRLRCAVQYSTAWVQPLVLALVILAMSPIGWLVGTSNLGRLSAPVFQLPAALLAAAGLLLWWLWCVRLGQTTPAETRTAVSRYFLLWTPLWCALIAGAAICGAWYAAPHLMRTMNLHW